MSAQKQLYSVALIIVAIIFATVAFAGANGDVAWSTLKWKGDSSAPTCTVDPQVHNLGLLGYYIRYQDESFCQNYNKDGYYVKYDSSGSNDFNTLYCEQPTSTEKGKDYCTKCDEAGKAIMAMMTFGLIAAIIAVVCTWGRYQLASKGEDNGGFRKLGGMGGSAAMVLFSLIAWSSWTACNTAANDASTELYSDYKTQLGTGFVLNIVITVLSGGAAALQFMT